MPPQMLNGSCLCGAASKLSADSLKTTLGADRRTQNMLIGGLYCFDAHHQHRKYWDTPSSETAGAVIPERLAGYGLVAM